MSPYTLNLHLVQITNIYIYGNNNKYGTTQMFNKAWAEIHTIFITSYFIHFWDTPRSQWHWASFIYILFIITPINIDDKPGKHIWAPAFL